MEYNSPLSLEKEKKLISLLKMTPDSQVIEVGCGNGKFLLSLMEAYEVSVLGVDTDSMLINQARGAADTRFENRTYRFICEDFQSLNLRSQSYDLLICNGSSHAFGAGAHAVSSVAQHANRLLKQGGLLLLGECYWKKAPPQAYLDFLGQDKGIYSDYKGNIDLVHAQGFNPIYATSSSQHEWDNFEWSHKQITRECLKGDPTNSQLKKKMLRIETWLDAYLKWGREHLGYGFYLFEKNTLCQK
ncbi:class I SAM-dependent methyltransferase [Pseudoalteromonas sp. SMS1]|uniref:class I SAM-dependent methyltransferase n=1 Tax=Pseudoalteromonas sp. SMS1 TaxID=2908894 RepID=UPI001F29710B|nr:class I SAM-dependent methyltransferase [Pseudoalteromonas sp. SMS1]MCF2860312.1 class I SAM-dependent methyltransferase [Pseudoalteromonas sp. SMS1]